MNHKIKFMNYKPILKNSRNKQKLMHKIIKNILKMISKSMKMNLKG